MEHLRVLTRDEMKKLTAGSLGPCRIYSDGEWGGCSWTEDEAQSWYENHPEVTGYCCASCGEEPYENAEPCPQSA